MKGIFQPSVDQEPVGIVISRGSRDEPTPVFLAYEWSPAPEPASESDVKAA